MLLSEKVISTVAGKILAIMREVKSVAKDKRNDFHKYDYTSDEAVVTAIREAMITHRLIVIPNQTQCSKEGTLTTLGVEYEIIDVDSGESVTKKVFGYGQDNGDKGVYKAATGAEKYFLLKTFLIPTGDDPENEKTNGHKAAANGHIKRPTSEMISEQDARAAFAAEMSRDSDLGIDAEPHYDEENDAMDEKIKEMAAANRARNPGLISDAQSKRFYAIAKSVNKTDADIKAFLKLKIDSEHTRDIPWKRYNALCEEIVKCGGVTQ